MELAKEESKEHFVCDFQQIVPADIFDTKLVDKSEKQRRIVYKALGWDLEDFRGDQVVSSRELFKRSDKWKT